MTGDSLRAEHLDEATSGSNHEELWAQLCKATLLGTERSQLSVSQLASI